MATINASNQYCCFSLLNDGTCGDNDCDGEGGETSGGDDANGEISDVEGTKASVMEVGWYWQERETEVAMRVEATVGYSDNHSTPPPPPPTAPQQQVQQQQQQQIEQQQSL